MAVAEKSTKTEAHLGEVVQIIGPVLDVQFEEGHLPEIYHALTTHPQLLPYLADVNSQYDMLSDHVTRQFSAQMVAMRNATDAAGDLISELALAANKARQGRITREMLEIASGAEALKG